MRLPPVLSPLDLPWAELQAARLDGELMAVDAAYSPIDEVITPRLRARAVHAGLVERLIAEQHSAAWIWGATPHPPPRQLCVAVGARVRLSHLAPVREVVIEPDELADLDGLHVTTPLRTVVDLARFSAAFGPEEVAIAVRLSEDHGFDVDDCLRELDRRQRLPNKRRALARLSAVGAALSRS